jgi:hypothetical protein
VWPQRCSGYIAPIEAAAFLSVSQLEVLIKARVVILIRGQSWSIQFRGDGIFSTTMLWMSFIQIQKVCCDDADQTTATSFVPSNCRRSPGRLFAWMNEESKLTSNSFLMAKWIVCFAPALESSAIWRPHAKPTPTGPMARKGRSPSVGPAQRRWRV